MVPIPTPREERGRVAGLTRHKGAEAPATIEAKRDLRAANLKRHIVEVVDQAPPLTDAQLTELSGILRGAR